MDTTTDARWIAKGTTDDVTTCDHCGREELKGTVRMVAVNAEGEEQGESFMGSTCAANMTGRPVADIRKEAKAADDDRRARLAAHREAESTEFMRASDYVLRTMGLERNFHSMKLVRADADFQRMMADWRAANPIPA